MQRLTRLLWLTFIESLATVLFERGVYFYTHERLGFGNALNLTLGLVFGLLYVASALAAHPIAVKVGEKRLLAAAIAVQVVMVCAILWWPTAAVLFTAAVVLGVCFGIKWPVIESYIAAGRDAAQQARAVGRFNIAWSSAVPAALILTGPLVSLDWHGPFAQGKGIFVVVLLCNAITLGLMRRLPRAPAHLPHDHPDRPPAAMLQRYRGLLASSRWSMLASYSLLFAMAPLMPGIFAGLGYGVKMAAWLSALIDLVRLGTFIVLERTSAWHGRVSLLVAVALLMPVGFFMVILGPNTAVVLTGEVLFGVAAGLSYYSALYYAMVVKNASVDAGGVHEGLIGTGFFMGPLVGLTGTWLTVKTASTAAGFALGVGPWIVVCLAAGVWTLRKARRA